MKSLRFGTAVSILALATTLSGCAAPSFKNAQTAQAAKANLAYGLRAQMALESGDFTSAIDPAEKAVEANPGDSTVRGLLANAYFAGGRFASADAAYADALALSPAQPQVILKRALAQIAQGKNNEALSLLESARNYLDAADYGLAVALAGQPVMNEARDFPIVFDDEDSQCPLSRPSSSALSLGPIPGPSVLGPTAFVPSY